MKPLYDFGISQEDANSEKTIFDLVPGDRVLCIASGGEVPLNILSCNRNIKITAIDISETQLALCRLKLLTALNMHAPQNAAFLGYSEMNKKVRKEIFFSKLFPLLEEVDQQFWLKNLEYIETGVINGGRFELFVKRFRGMARLIIGSKNIEDIINCESIQEQQKIFDEKIKSRKILRYLFLIMFHPSIYKKRGLNKQGLIHARADTGNIFFKKFRSFCINTRAGLNYFLQYFLTGNCTENAIPEFLKKENQSCLIKNLDSISFKKISITEAIEGSNTGYYNKIHLSNIGDWMDEKQFKQMMEILDNKLLPGSKISYRFLQKNHFALHQFQHIEIDKKLEEILKSKDRFPFYSIIPIKTL